MGQLIWKSPSDNPLDRKVLHFRYKPDQPWQIYSKHPLAEPDVILGKFGNLPAMPTSRGWTTMQKLLTLGYTLVPSPGVASPSPVSQLSEDMKRELVEKSLIRP